MCLDARKAALLRAFPRCLRRGRVFPVKTNNLPGHFLECKRFAPGEYPIMSIAKQNNRGKHISSHIEDSVPSQAL